MATVLIGCQLILGGLVRHTPSTLAQRVHIMLAFAVAAAAVWLMKSAVDGSGEVAPYRSLAALLAALVGVQVLLGIEALFIKFAAGPLPELQTVTVGQGIVRTAHFLVGSFVFAASISLALRVGLRVREQIGESTLPAHRLEGTT
jgi:heme A synthase